MSIATPSEDVHGAVGSLPAFVERAREDAQCRAALARIGYSKVKAAYTQQMRDNPASDVFRGLEGENLWPPIDLVREWLKTERNRNIARTRWTFLAAMVVTIVTGLAAAAAYSVLG